MIMAHMEVEVGLQSGGLRYLRVYADNAEERRLGLEALQMIQPELESIERKLFSVAGFGSRALGDSK
jgi:hypothetical protein